MKLKNVSFDQKLLISSGMNQEEKKQLEEWTGLQCKEILFDSNIDKADDV